MIEIEENAFGYVHPEVAGSHYQLARMLRETGRYTEAEKFFRKSVDSRKRFLGENHPSTFCSVIDLAITLQYMGNFAEAIRLHVQSDKKIRESMNKDWPTHIGGNELVEMLASLKEALGQYDAAAPLWQSLIDGASKFEREQLDVATPLRRLANAFVETKEHTKAEDLFRRSIVTCENLGARGFPIYAHSVYGLAGLLHDLKRHEEAEVLYREALTAMEKLFGRENPEVAACLNDLGTLLRDTGRYSEAETLLREAVSIRIMTLGQAHVQTARSQRNLATVFLATDRAVEALQYSELSLAAFESIQKVADQVSAAEGIDVRVPPLKDSARTCADALTAMERRSEAMLLRTRYGLEGA